MASRKQLKKDINNIIGALIEEIYLWELAHPKADIKKSEALIDESIQLFDELIAKIRANGNTPAKVHFKQIQTELVEKANGISTRLSKLA